MGGGWVVDRVVPPRTRPGVTAAKTAVGDPGPVKYSKEAIPEHNVSAGTRGQERGHGMSYQ